MKQEVLSDTGSAGDCTTETLVNGRKNEASVVRLASVSGRHAEFLLLKVVSIHHAFASLGYLGGFYSPGISSDDRNSLFVLGIPTLSFSIWMELTSGRPRRAPTHPHSSRQGVFDSGRDM